MKEILKSIIEVSKERIKNPLIGTFIFVWIAINWKPIIILFSSEKTILERIKLIEKDYSSHSTYFTIPFSISLFYVVILPYLMWGIEFLVKKSTLERKKNITAQTVKDFEGKIEIAEKESELENIKSRYRDKSNLNLKIENLQKQLNERDKILNKQKINLENSIIKNEELANHIILLENESSKEQNSEFSKLYFEFSKSDIFKYFKEVGLSIRENNDFPQNVEKIIKEKFLVLDIINIEEGEGKFGYDFTRKGEYFWKKFILDTENENKLQKEPIDLPF